ncbi:MAG: S9 family peptidase [Candidatus Riflebacteria bacterium]|nr:S9 family peptidase [Candidatus Riflebacteria bacterium]
MSIKLKSARTLATGQKKASDKLPETTVRKNNKVVPVTKKRPITPEDLLNLHLTVEPRISPDGSRIVFAKRHVSEKNRMSSNLWIVESNGKTPRQITFCGKANRGRFSPDGRLLAFVSGRNKPQQQIFLLDLEAGGEARALTSFPEGDIGTFDFSPNGKMIGVTFREKAAEWTEEACKKRQEDKVSDPPHVIDDLYYRLDGDGVFNRQRHHLYRVDIATGDTQKIFDKAPLGISGFTWSPDSTSIAFAANLDSEPILHPWMDRLYKLNVETKKLMLLPGQDKGTRMAAAWSPNGKYIAYAGRSGFEVGWEAKNMHLFIYDITKKCDVDLNMHVDLCLESFTISDTGDISYVPNLLWTPDSKQVIAAIGIHGTLHPVAFNLAGGAPDFLTEGSRIVKFGSLSSNGKYAAATVGSMTRPEEIYIAERRGKYFETRELTKFNEKLLKTLDLVEPEEHWIEASDGHAVHLWVMKPVGLTPRKRVPAILEIHGGPHAQYGCAFFHEFQVLAAAGYAVFFGNPRGSKGYGEAHCTAIQGGWGDKDWMDIQAISGFMRQQPYVDVRRTGVTGGSYGGYMTNWAIGHTNEFAAAITDRSVSNLISLFGTSDLPTLPDTYWQGCAWERPETLWDQSPIKYFGRVSTPTLIIHSEGDLRCNVEQADQVFTTLKILGVPTRLVRYPLSTSHGMSRGGPPDLKLHRLNQILDWWKRFL